MNIQEYTRSILEVTDKCTECGNPTKYNTKLRGFQKYCSIKCSAISEETKKKRKETSMERFGVENSSQIPENRERAKQTCVEKYGIENVLNLPHNRQLTTKIIRETKQELLEKREKTNLERYGVTCTLNSSESIKKKKKTWKEHYGVCHPSQSPEVRLKTINTCMERYGVTSPLKSDIIQDRMISTCVHRYGVSNPSQYPEFSRKALGSLFRTKPYTLPSGRIVKLLGYEPQFLDYVFDNKIFSEDEIEYSPARVEYIGFDNKKHYYFPDFYISKINLLIEIKSKWTETQDKNLLLKERACIRNGFNYIRITNNNFDRFCDYVTKSTA